MTTSATLVLSAWRIFIDGVEIPHQGFVATTTEGAISSVVITAEPGIEVTMFRPQAILHMFVKDVDPEVDSVDDLDTYVLFWEGLYTGYSFSKTPTNRSIILKARDLQHILEATSAFQLSIGPYVYSSVFTGSALPPLAAGILEGAVAANQGMLIPGVFAQILRSDLEGLGSFRDPVEPQFVHRITRLITYLANHNALLRQQLVRTRFFNKIVSVPDSAIGSFLSLTSLLNVMGQAQNSIQAENTVLDVIQHLLGYGFGRITPIFLPHFSKKQPETVIQAPSLTTETLEDQYAIGVDFYRNDFVMHADMYYALPPACNLVLPDTRISLDIDRDFYSEPTRFLLQDGISLAVGNPYSYFLAPRAIVDADPSVTSAEVFAIATAFAGSVEMTDELKTSAYAYPAGGDANSTKAKNLLRPVTPAELEKGMVTASTNSAGYELFSAFSNIRKAGDSEGEAVKGLQDSEYRQFVSDITEYQYQMLKYQRTGSAVLSGHRWIVPGASILLYDSDITYMACVEGLTFQVAATGSETTSLRLSKVRAVPTAKIPGIKQVLVSALKMLSVNAPDAPFEEPVDEDLPVLSIDRSAADEVLAAAKLARKIKEDSEGILSISLSDLPAALKNQVASINTFLRQYTSVEEIPAGPFIRLVADADTLDSSSIGDQFTAISAYWTAISTKLANLEFTDPELYDWIRFVLDGGALPDIPSSPKASKLYNVYRVSFADAPGFSLYALRKAVRGQSIQTDENNITWLDQYADELSRAEGLADLSARYFDLSHLAAELVAPFVGASAASAAAPPVESAIDRIEALLNSVEEDLDLPIPPRFFNAELSTLAGLDKVYGEVYGSKPLYNTPAKEKQLAEAKILVTQLKEAAGKLGSTDKFKATVERIGYITEYLTGLERLHDIYPFMVAVKDKKSEWETAATGQATGPYEWYIRSYGRRKACTLRQFLQSNKLKLVKLYSDSPSTAFYQFSPVETYQVGGLRWDDSIFSKVVDDRRLRGVSPDALIAEIRTKLGTQALQSLTASYLRTDERQAPVLAYSRKHFGSRAYDGT